MYRRGACIVLPGHFGTRVHVPTNLFPSFPCLSDIVYVTPVLLWDSMSWVSTFWRAHFLLVEKNEGS